MIEIHVAYYSLRYFTRGIGKMKASGSTVFDSFGLFFCKSINLLFMTLPWLDNL